MNVPGAFLAKQEITIAKLLPYVTRVTPNLYEEKFQEALFYYNRALSLDKKRKDKKLSSSVISHIGVAYQGMGKVERAKEFFTQAIELDPNNMIAIFSLSNLCFEVKEYPVLHSYLSSKMDSISDINDKNLVCYRLYELNKEHGNFKDALTFLEKSNLLLDSIMQNKYNSQLLEIEKKYAKQQVLTDNIRLQLERNQVLYLSTVLLVSFLITFLLYRLEINQRKRKSIETKIESERQQHELWQQRQITEHKEHELEQASRLVKLMKSTLFRNSIIYNKIKLISRVSIQDQKKKRIYQDELEKLFGEPSFSEFDKQRLKDFTDGLYPNFTTRLLKIIPNLSEDEVVFCCLVTFELSLGELAVILNLTVNTVKSKRYRIMRKAGVTNMDFSLEEYLKSIQEESGDNEFRDGKLVAVQPVL